jgi:hypothetical protein
MDSGSRWAWVLVPAALMPSLATAQSGRQWIDPPAELSVPAAPEAGPPRPLDGTSDRSVEPPPPLSAQRPAAPSRTPQEETENGTVTAAQPAALERTARNLAFKYMEYWSAPNHLTLDTAPLFYAPIVDFHGRRVSVRTLMAEKRRFVQRWPDRHYRYRPDTMAVSCDPDRRTCVVQSLFDFMASNPARRLHSRGVGRHELVIGFTDDRPAIVAETSQVLGQSRTP